MLFTHTVTRLLCLFFFLNATATSDIYTYCHTLALIGAFRIFGGCRRVIGDRMRQDRGVRLGMRHVETAAERVAQLMMQGDRRRTQYHACEPASVKRLRPRLEIGRASCRERVCQYV